MRTDNPQRYSLLWPPQVRNRKFLYKDLRLIHTVRFFLNANAICFCLMGYIGVGDVVAVAQCENFR